MGREAELFDGTVLEFEEGTTDDVIKKVAERETSRLRDTQARKDLPAGTPESIAGAGRGSIIPTEPQGPSATLADIRSNQASRKARFDTQSLASATAPPDGSSVMDLPIAPAGPNLSNAEVAQLDTMSTRAGANPPPMQPSPGSVKETPPEIAAAMDFRRATGGSGAAAALQGAVGGYAALGKTVPGLVAAGADLVGADNVSKFALGAAQRAEGFSQAVEPQGGYYNKLIGNVFSSTVQSLPTLAFGAGGATEIIAGKAVTDAAAKAAFNNAMKELFVQTAGQEYADARNNGADPLPAGARAAIFGASEVLGERFGFHEQMAVAKASVKALLGKKGGEVSAKQLANVMATEVLKEIPGEELTTALEFLADKYGPAAQNPKATLQDYFQQAADTAVQTIGQTALMGAPAGIVHSTKDAFRRADAAIAYNQARISGFQVDPPLTTDEPKVRRSKTEGIFENLAAQYGIPSEAVKRAIQTSEGMPIDQIGPFFADFTRALQQHGEPGLSGQPVDEHAIDTLTAGPIDPPPDETKSAKGETKPAPRETVRPESGTERAKPATEGDYTGLSEPEQAVSNIERILGADLKTADDQPYGTRAGAQARATREGGGEVVEVPGGWVVRPEGTTPSVQDIHDLADSKGIAWDNDPAFMALTKEVTGKEHLDDLTSEQRTALAQRLTAEKSATEAPGEPAQPDLQRPAAVAPAAPAGRGPEPAGGRGTVGPVAADTGRPAKAPAKAPVPSVRPPGPVAPGGGQPAPVGRVIARVGQMPKQATPLELRENPDGSLTAWLDGHEVLDYDTAEPVTVPKGSTDQQALDAVKASGALGRRMKVFSAKPEGEGNAPHQVQQQEGVPGEHRTGDSSGQTPEAGGGDRVQREGTGTEGAAAVPGEPGTAAAPVAAPAPAAPAARTLTDQEAFTQDYAAFDGKTLEQKIQITGTNETATLRIDAAKAMRLLDQRERALTELKACIGRTA